MNRTILEGDVSEKIKEISDNSIDLICTDPPYGYSFMNKDWDKVVISSNVWRECLRVLKPGSFAFVMSAPRQDVLYRVTKNLEDAGFNIGFTSLYWAYASGFPKAMNVSKAVDKKLGFEPEIIGKKKWNNFQKHFVPTEDHTQRVQLNDTKPTSPQAKKLDGAYAGFQPKPAVEVILVCMKPLSQKNYVEQALYNGKGVTWFDDCRIPFNPETNDKRLSGKGSWSTEKTAENIYQGGYAGDRVTSSEKGRFPANLIVSDNALDDGKKHKSGTLEAHHIIDSPTTKNCYGEYDRLPAGLHTTYGDEGSFSRYFDLDSWEAQFIITPKPSKSEKNKGLKQYQYKIDMYEGEYPKSQVIGEKVNDGRKTLIDNPFQRGETIRQNTHPTVKPISLFKYLITMGSRVGDIILDPFMGSGTTAIACEKLARKWIGIEINPEYKDIIDARLKDHIRQQKLFQ